MTECRSAHAAAPHWTEAVVLCLERLEDNPPSGGLGFIYVTDGFANNLPEIADYLRSNTGIRNWVGTVGFGICAQGRNYFDEPALSILVADLPDHAFRVLDSLRDPETDLAGGEGSDAGSDPSFGVIHADPRNPALSELIEGLAGQSNGFLVGGLSSSRGGFPQVGRTVGDGGISGVLISSEVPVMTAHSQSCEPIGPYHDVTECEDNLAIELDDRPAVDVFAEDLVAGLGEEVGDVTDAVLVGFPIAGSDTGDYLVRQLVGFDSDRGVIGVSQQLGHGDRLMFCRRDRVAAERDFVRMLEGLKKRLPGTPSGGLYYSCLARGPNLFGPGAWELDTIADVLGDFPITGFYCNGEISNNRLYTFTGVLTLFV